ncbi:MULTISPECIES: class I SAM-dependent methyltransferase [Frankia]|uniref:Methyltransferase domain-containing protein n=1 Tax=Frankia alni (strain DSM 45986 / CECT 9034 / ACN14a) TaxID=326424 RepID=Q0RPS7_FRAAA|nr:MULTISPECIES: class I SAM-dependent methyltransferase [Frankia]CAJ60453.1 hypothetical protein; putative SAM binding motif [Frankia alni ACN14a]
MNAAIWERHARARIAAGDLHRSPGPSRFVWTCSDTGDPGPALLGDIAGRRVVELGCGTGDNLAHLVDHCGARGLGIDAAPSQIRRAQARWPHLDVQVTGAARYLLTAAEPIDVCYSVFGAVGLTPALPLIALIRRRLTPGGLLAFSVRSTDRQRATPATPEACIHWHAHPPATWTRLLSRHGFVDIRVRHADSDLSPHTLIITARADPDW